MVLASLLIAGCSPRVQSHRGAHNGRHDHPHCHGVDDRLCHDHRHGPGHHESSNL